MRQPPKAILGVLLLCALVLGGCGADSPAAAKAVPKINVRSTAISGDVLPARFTCDGRDISPPLEWGAVPPSVGRLALFLIGFTPDAATGGYSISVEWAVAGLNPALHRLAAGQLPAGAYLGVATDGKRQRYSVCPKKGTSVHYQFELYGIPASIVVSPQFAGASILSALTTPNSPTPAAAHGGFVAIYTRK